LTKGSPELTRILIELGWRVPLIKPSGVSGDPTAFMLKENGKTKIDSDLIFNGNKNSVCRSIELFDTKSPIDATEFTKAEFSVSLTDIPSDIQKVSVCLLCCFIIIRFFIISIYGFLS